MPEQENNAAHKFDCSKCGLCCKRISQSAVTRHLDRGDGVCMHLRESDNLCLIYDQRPLFCRVDDGYKLFEQQMTMSEYYALNSKVCRELNKQG